MSLLCLFVPVCKILHYFKLRFALFFINTPYISRQEDSFFGHRLFTSAAIYYSGVMGASAPTWPLALLICVCLCDPVWVGWCVYMHAGAVQLMA